MMESMRCWIGLFLALLCSQVAAEEKVIKLLRVDCATVGSPVALAETDRQFLTSVSGMFKNKKRGDLFALVAPNAKIMRRFVEAAGQRGGDMTREFDRKEFGKDFVIRIPRESVKDADGNSMVFRAQTLREFGYYNPRLDGTAVFMGHKVCDGAWRCDVLPESQELENLIGGLSRCNKSMSNVFVFTDGMLVMDMEKHQGYLPTGEALFFSKTSSGYKLSVLISFQ